MFSSSEPRELVMGAGGWWRQTTSTTAPPKNDAPWQGPFFSRTPTLALGPQPTALGSWLPPLGPCPTPIGTLWPLAQIGGHVHRHRYAAQKDPAARRGLGAVVGLPDGVYEARGAAGPDRAHRFLLLVAVVQKKSRRSRSDGVCQKLLVAVSQNVF